MFKVITNRKKRVYIGNIIEEENHLQATALRQKERKITRNTKESKTNQRRKSGKQIQYRKVVSCKQQPKHKVKINTFALTQRKQNNPHVEITHKNAWKMCKKAEVYSGKPMNTHIHTTTGEKVAFTLFKDETIGTEKEKSATSS